MTQNRKMPKRNDIHKYWSDRLVQEYDKFWMEDIDDAYKGHQCYACGCETITQRCHILPKNKGGNDDISNLHCLCPECHIESECLNSENYWKWFAYKNTQNSGSYLRLINGFQSFIESNPQAMSMNYDELQVLLDAYIQ